MEFKPDVSHHIGRPDALRFVLCLLIRIHFIPTNYAYLRQGDWKATGVESGTKFSGIDLTEGEWFDYDEKAGEEVSIKEVKWEIRRA